MFSGRPITYFTITYNYRSQFYFTFLFQTKEQQEQVLNQSNKVFLYCAFLDYRWMCQHDSDAACFSHSFRCRATEILFWLIFSVLFKLLNHNKWPMVWRRCISLFSFKSETSSVTCVAVSVWWTTALWENKYGELINGAKTQFRKHQSF